MPRRQRFVFRARVPSDFGTKELTWTIAANGRTEKAYGNLLPAQEISERVVMTSGNFNPGRDDPNRPPSVAVAPLQSATVGTPLTLTVEVADDGLPAPRTAPAPSRPSPATTFGAQVNTSGTPARRGMTVTWLQYRGPARAAFSARGSTALLEGKATTSVTFTEPGAYDLRVTANDGALSTRKHTTVHVKAAPQP
jgi:hypothetical protein